MCEVALAMAFSPGTLQQERRLPAARRSRMMTHREVKKQKQGRSLVSSPPWKKNQPVESVAQVCMRDVKQVVGGGER